MQHCIYIYIYNHIFLHLVTYGEPSWPYCYKTLKNITHGQIALDLVLDDAVFFDMLGRGKREREREREREDIRS